MIRKMIRKIALNVSFNRANKRLNGVFEHLHRRGIVGQAGHEMGCGFMCTAIASSNGVIWGIRKSDAISIEDARRLQLNNTTATVKHGRLLKDI